MSFFFLIVSKITDYPVKEILRFLFKVYSGVIILKDFDSSPLLAEVGQDLSLFCNYQVLITHLSKDDRVYDDDQVMGDSLYSIKWYRDDSEFFRYIPKGLKIHL